MNTTRPPVYIIILAILAALILMAAAVAGLLSLGRYSSPASVLTAIGGGISGTILACVAAWINDVIQELKRPAPPIPTAPRRYQENS